MLFGRIFLALNGLIGVLLGGFVAASNSLSSLGIEVHGSALIEVRTGLGGAWICVGLFWLFNSFGRRVRSATVTLGAFYLVTALIRFYAMQGGGATDQTLMFLVFEVVVGVVAVGLSGWVLAPNRRRIFG